MTAQDQQALAGFRCTKLGEPWADDVQSLIRDELVGSITAGILEAEGIWVEADLAGLIAWRVERDPAVRAKYGDQVWQSALLAVSVDHRGERHARALKGWLLNEAHAQGIQYVTSYVHWNNQLMIDMNRRLGGSMARVMKGPFSFDEEFGRCIVPVTEWPPLETGQ